MNKPVSVLHVCREVSIRAIKEVLTSQRDPRINTHLLYKQSRQPEVQGYIQSTSQWVDPVQLEFHLTTGMRRCDVIHVHTTFINVMLIRDVVTIARRLPEGNRPRIVWDMHDMDWGDDEAVTRLIPYFEGVDSVIVPSYGYKTYVDGLVPYEGKCTVVYSMVPKILYPRLSFRAHSIDCVALATGVCLPGNGPIYRDYKEVQASLRVPMMIFQGNSDPELQMHYDNLMGIRRYPKLLEELSQYKMGYAGAANSRHDIDICVTNKFFEYIAADLPIITYKSDEMRRFMLEYWYGCDFKALDDEEGCIYPDPLPDRFDFTMETQIPKLLEVYSED